MAPVHDPQLPADHACLIVHGSDKPGIVAAVSAMITRIGGNIVAFDQFSDCLLYTSPSPRDRG